ncbi:LXG domain-containing protein [Bacillus sp. JJ634]
MKTLDSHPLHNGIEDLLKKIKSQMDQLKELENSIDNFSGLDDSFNGKGGKAIRAFYQDWHVPILSFYQFTLKNYEKVLTKIKAAATELESHPSGFIRQSFLEGELTNGLNKIKLVTTDLVDEANRTMDKVNDIVYAPRLSDAQFHSHIQRADKEINQTIGDLNTFDTTQTNELNTVEQDIQLMKNYISEIEGMFKSGELSIESYNINQLKEKPIYSKLETEVKETTAPVTSLLSDSTVKNDTKDAGFHPTEFDPYAPIAGMNWFGTSSEAIAVSQTIAKTFKGYEVIRNDKKIKITDGKVIQRKKRPAGRLRAKYKIYDRTNIKDQMKRGNYVKAAEFANVKGAAHAALKSSLTAASIGLDVFSDTKSNVEEGASKTKITGDILGDIAVGVGTTAAAAGLTIFVLPVAAPVAAVAAAGFVASVGLTYFTEGVKWNTDTNKDGEDDSIKDMVKYGFWKSIGTVAGWLK